MRALVRSHPERSEGSALGWCRSFVAALLRTTPCWTLALGACTFGERQVAQGTDRPVVHGVLNPVAFEQSVLVEHTLTGRVTVTTDSVANPDDPIVSGGGVPFTDAKVTIIAPDGSTAAAVQKFVVRNGTAPAVPTGVYQILNAHNDAVNVPLPPGFGRANMLPILPGQRYRLRVELADGRVTTGSTRVPGDASTRTTDDFSALTFDRTTDTLRLRWAPVPGARTYALRVATPYGAFFAFSDSTAFSFTGDMRNLFTDPFPRLFLPGFTQYVYVAAVDTNYFDYYRSTNNPFTGSGIINRLDGGIGLFGGYTPVVSRAVFVRADSTDPIDGRYFARGPGGTEQLRVWVDSRANGITALTGAYRLPGGDQYGFTGTLEGEHVQIRTVDHNDIRYIYRLMDGRLHGDTIQVALSGVLPGDDPRTRVFVRGPAPATTP